VLRSAQQRGLYEVSRTKAVQIERDVAIANCVECIDDTGPKFDCRWQLLFGKLNSTRVVVVADA
jgi:hypothetical protein